ncbi:unnamed protein product [Calypogeia fissa]
MAIDIRSNPNRTYGWWKWCLQRHLEVDTECLQGATLVACMLSYIISRAKIVYTAQPPGNGHYNDFSSGPPVGPTIFVPPIEEEGLQVVSAVLGKAWDEKKANVVVGAGDVQAMVVPLVEYIDDDKEDDIEVDSFDANWGRSVIGDTDVALISGLLELYAVELEEYRFVAAYGLRFEEGGGVAGFN